MLIHEPERFSVIFLRLWLNAESDQDRKKLAILFNACQKRGAARVRIHVSKPYWRVMTVKSLNGTMLKTVSAGGYGYWYRENIEIEG
jgi:hypothetical protein